MAKATVLEQIKKFVSVSGHPRNQWFTGEGIEIYLRKSTHFVSDERVECIDIANVSVNGVKGIGIFTYHLSGIEKLAKENNLAIYVENILEQRFQDFFARRGYSVVMNSQPVCMFKKF